MNGFTGTSRCAHPRSRSDGRTASFKVWTDTVTGVVAAPAAEDDAFEVKPGESIGRVHTWGLAVAVVSRGRSERRGAKMETVESMECHVSRLTWSW